MPWDELLGHRDAIDRFRRSIDRNRLASTYLFIGPEGIGKRTFALQLAQALLCQTHPPEQLEACGTCSPCQQVTALTHPDLILINKPADKAYIPVETFIGDREHRRQRGLCHDIGLKPFSGGRKIAIINDADYLNQEGANCLLKTLEEPPPKSLLILIGTSEQRQLSTIVSRSQIVRFGPLATDQVATILHRQPDLESDRPLDQLAAASAGSVAAAVRLSEADVFDFRVELYQYLAGFDPEWNIFTKTITTFVDAAGKDGASKRARLSMVADQAIAFYQSCYERGIGSQSATGTHADAVLDTAVSQWLEKRQSIDSILIAQRAGDCIHRCGDLQRHVFANVNATTAIDAWLRDLSRLDRGAATANVS